MSPRLLPTARWLRAGVGVAATLGLLLTPAAAANAQDDDQLNILRDTEIEAILHQEMDPIFAAANLDPSRVELYLVGDPDVNAETGAGYHMIITTGLIMQATAPNELQGVLAHETGHMERGDVAHSGEEMHQAIAPMIAALGLGLLAALAGQPGAAAGLMYSSQYFGELNVLSYSRDQEARADEAAVTYLEKAGYSAQGLVDFFNATLRTDEVFTDIKKYPYFIDHPLSTDRVEALAVRARAQPHWGVKDTPEMIAQFEIMKAKIKAFVDRPYQTLIDFPETDTSFPARYARAIAYYRELETDKAITAIDALIAERPDDPYLYELKGQALMESGRAVEGEAPLRQAVTLKPDAPLLRLLLAEDLISEDDNRKLDDAIVNLNRSLVVEPDSPLAWQYLSEAYDTKGDEGMARLAAAEQNYNLGQMQEARSFAMRAREFLKRGTPEWNRATDIVLTSNPSPDDLRMLSQPE